MAARPDTAGRYPLGVIWLFACTAPVEDTGMAPVEETGGDTSIDTGETGDTGVPVVDVEPGPDCSRVSWPIETPWNVLAAHLVAGAATPDHLEELDELLTTLEEDGSLGPAGERLRGPWIDLAESETEALLEQVSVPEVVVGPDDDLWLVFVDGDLETLRWKANAGLPIRSGIIGFAGLGVAHSDNGYDWTREEMVLEGDDLPVVLVDPDVQQLSDGSYRLYALGFRADAVCGDTVDPFQYPAPHEVWTFTSDDLVTWQQEDIVWDHEKGTDPATWCAGETCWIHMRHSGVSSDGGATFESTTLSLPDDEVHTPDVRPTSSGFEMLYNTQGAQSMHRATSDDGESFVEVQQLDLPGDAPTAVTWQGQTWMYTKSRQ